GYAGYARDWSGGACAPDGSGTDVAESGASVTTSGSLSGLVQFGADGPAANAFTFVSQTAASAWVHSLGAGGLESHGSLLDHATVDRKSVVSGRSVEQRGVA